MNNEEIQRNPVTTEATPPQPAADCKPLLAACTPQLYVENSFRITGLQVYATARDIRRRQEDLKAVEETSDWHGEHRQTLPFEESPTPDQVNTAFLKLQDPECRLIDELFWFWPLTAGGGKQDEAIHQLKTGNGSKACQIWEDTPRHSTHEGFAALHNLAVYHHLHAIEWEKRSQQTCAQHPSSTDLPRIIEHWQKAISYWETITDEDAFWKMISDRIKAMDDPRMTTGFARRLRATFPIAIDQINALLAQTYAEAGHFEHARRHVKYMEETQTGQGDVEKTIRTVFAPLAKRVNMLVEHAVTDSRKTPEEGLKNARHLLQASKEPLSVAKGLLDEGHTIRTILFDSVAEACFSCLIVYGNKTDDWRPCSDMLTELEKLAVSKEAKNRIRDNRDVAKKNHEDKTLREQCWFCKQNSQDEKGSLSVNMYGEVRPSSRTIGSTPDYNPFTCTWRQITIHVPRCRSCVSLFRSYREKSEYPPIKDLLSKGWKFGDKPTDDEMKKACGLQTSLQRAGSQFLGIIGVVVVLGIIGFISDLSSCQSSHSNTSSYTPPPQSAPYHAPTPATTYVPAQTQPYSYAKSALKTAIEDGKQSATKLENDLAAYDQQIEQLKDKLDRYNRAEMITEYNALVPEYNSLVTRRKATYAEYSRLIVEINEKVRRYNAREY